MLRLPLFLIVMVAGLLLSFGGAFATGAKPTSKPKLSIEYVPAAFYVQGGCDIADLQGQAFNTDKSGPFPKWQRHAARLLDTRIAACEEIIKNWVDAAAAPTAVVPEPIASQYGLPKLFTPQSHCHQLKVNDPLREYAMLHYCVTWIGRYVPAALPSPTMAPISGPSPLNNDSAWHKYVYVLALAPDMPTSAQIVYHLRDSLDVIEKPTPDIYTHRQVTLSLVADPGITLPVFQQMCYSDSSIAGAIVALPPSTQVNGWNAAVIAATWTTVAWQTLVFDCKPTNRSYVNNALYLEWAAGVEVSKGKTVYNIPIASALAVLAGIQAWPGNSSSNSGVAALAAVGVAALTPLQSASIGEGTDPTGLLADAIAKAVPQVASALLSPCLNSMPNATGSDSSPNPGLSRPVQCSWITQKDNH